MVPGQTMPGPRPNHAWSPAKPCLVPGHTMHCCRPSHALRRAKPCIVIHQDMHVAPPHRASFRAMSGICPPTLLSTVTTWALLLSRKPPSIFFIPLPPHPRISLQLKPCLYHRYPPSNNSSHTHLSMFTVLSIPGRLSILANPRFIHSVARLSPLHEPS
ncbi:hypothetical protein BDZ89DRAFT_202598 [Hymenopellis radicata]|nr:hypothetical protein BDZ89DRAFT_202598 [Hymenopellis radicata]